MDLITWTHGGLWQVRLMLVLAPAACCLAAVALHEVLRVLTRSIRATTPAQDSAPSTADASSRGRARRAGPPAPAASTREGSSFNPLPKEAAWLSLYFLVCVLAFYMFHCVWVSAEMYSAPSIVLQSRGGDGSLHVFDDFREAYAWLRYNTRPDTKVLIARFFSHRPVLLVFRALAPFLTASFT